MKIENKIFLLVHLILFFLSVNNALNNNETKGELSLNEKFENRFNLTRRKGLITAFEWKTLDLKYSSEYDKQKAIENGDFIPDQVKSVPWDVDVYYSGSQNTENLVFLTVPRRQLRIPATLNIVNNDGLLTPYPRDWDWHLNLKQCKKNRLVAVYRVMIDECDRLWVLDTGILVKDLICPPQLLAFDIKTNQVIARYEIPSDQYKPRGQSILGTPVVDVRDPKSKCHDTFVYIADVTGFGLIVYDYSRNTSWRITNNLFYPYPNAGRHEILGESFNLMDGILGMSLSPLVPGQDRTLYFHALSSFTENRVLTSVIRNRTLFLNNTDGASQKFHVYPKTRTSQAGAEAIDRNGIQYFILNRDLALACWNIRNEYGGPNINILEHNRETLQFGSGVKVINNRKSQELWIMLTDTKN